MAQVPVLLRTLLARSAGVVKGASGGIVSGVKVTLTNTSTNAKLETSTYATGGFQFLQLAPATYSVAAEAQGFRKLSVPSLLVEVDQITHLDLPLEVGRVTGSVYVESVPRYGFVPGVSALAL